MTLRKEMHFDLPHFSGMIVSDRVSRIDRNFGGKFCSDCVKCSFVRYRQVMKVMVGWASVLNAEPDFRALTS